MRTGKLDILQEEGRRDSDSRCGYIASRRGKTTPKNCLLSNLGNSIAFNPWDEFTREDKAESFGVSA